MVFLLSYKMMWQVHVGIGIESRQRRPLQPRRKVFNLTELSCRQVIQMQLSELIMLHYGVPDPVFVADSLGEADK